MSITPGETGVNGKPGVILEFLTPEVSTSNSPGKAPGRWHHTINTTPEGLTSNLTIRTPVLPGLFRLLRTTRKRVPQKGHPLFSLLSLSFAPPKESNQRKGGRKYNRYGKQAFKGVFLKYNIMSFNYLINNGF